jgi:clan AA aspartic protease
MIAARMRLSNHRRVDLEAVDVDALVDTGALHLCIPEQLSLQLDLVEIYRREVTMADGTKQLVPYVGPIQLTFENRGCFTGALVLGNEVLLGAVPMEDLDLVVLPAERRLAVNPASPNIPSSVAKRR